MDSKIIKFKHAGVQQEVLDQLLTKNWRLLTNPSLVFSQCLETNLRPFFWDKPDDYSNYSLVRVLMYLLKSFILKSQIQCSGNFSDVHSHFLWEGFKKKKKNNLA